MCQIFYSLLALAPLALYSDVNTGGTATTLDAAIATVNSGPDFVLNFDQNVSLDTQVRALNSDSTFTWAAETITVNGNNRSLDGTSTKRGIFIGGKDSSSTGSVTINNLNFNNLLARGGRGGRGGGGGMGAGGAVYAGRDTVLTIRNCSFQACRARGGSGRAFITGVGGGGGGLTGTSPSTATATGGGGFGGDGAGSNSGGGGGGASDFSVGNASGTVPGKDFDGGGISGNPGVGGDGTLDIDADSADFGGGGGASLSMTIPTAGGNGGKYGGGGRGFTKAGDGGFGGGGAGVANSFPALPAGVSVAGDGGFGGGGGSVYAAGLAAGTGGFGGGDGAQGDTAFGGVGAGFGGAIFLEQGAICTLEGSVSFSACNAIVGFIGNANTDPLAGFGALGDEIFMMSSSTLIVDSTSDIEIPSPIGGNQGNESPDPTAPTDTGGLIKRGSARLTLNGDNLYTGDTLVEEGRLHIPDMDSIITDVSVSDGATLSGDFFVKEDIQGHGGSIVNAGMVCPGETGVGSIALKAATHKLEQAFS